MSSPCGSRISWSSIRGRFVKMVAVLLQLSCLTFHTDPLKQAFSNTALHPDVNPLIPLFSGALEV